MLTCPDCRSTCPNGSRFCIHCGKSLQQPGISRNENVLSSGRTAGDTFTIQYSKSLFANRIFLVALTVMAVSLALFFSIFVLLPFAHSPTIAPSATAKAVEDPTPPAITTPAPMSAALLAYLNEVQPRFSQGYNSSTILSHQLDLIDQDGSLGYDNTWITKTVMMTASLQEALGYLQQKRQVPPEAGTLDNDLVKYGQQLGMYLSDVRSGIDSGDPMAFKAAGRERLGSLDTANMVNAELKAIHDEYR